MSIFTVQRYICIETQVEADSAEDALQIEGDLDITGNLTSEGALAFSWWLSDAIGATVTDSAGETVLEAY